MYERILEMMKKNGALITTRELEYNYKMLFEEIKLYNWFRITKILNYY